MANHKFYVNLGSNNQHPFMKILTANNNPFIDATLISSLIFLSNCKFL
jgi:hypothetical protein